jgi:hypothetical protein
MYCNFCKSSKKKKEDVESAMFGEFISHDTSCLVYILDSNGKAFQHVPVIFFLDS